MKSLHDELEEVKNSPRYAYSFVTGGNTFIYNEALLTKLDKRFEVIEEEFENQKKTIGQLDDKIFLLEKLIPNLIKRIERLEANKDGNSRQEKF